MSSGVIVRLTEFLEDFPGVTRKDAIAALEEARISFAAEVRALRQA
jgi:uncharacterized protein (DUF433 family)